MVSYLSHENGLCSVAVQTWTIQLKSSFKLLFKTLFGNGICFLPASDWSVLLSSPSLRLLLPSFLRAVIDPFQLELTLFGTAAPLFGKETQPSFTLMIELAKSFRILFPTSVLVPVLFRPVLDIPFRCSGTVNYKHAARRYPTTQFPNLLETGQGPPTPFHPLPRRNQDENEYKSIRTSPSLSLSLHHQLLPQKLKLLIPFHAPEEAKSKPRMWRRALIGQFEVSVR